MNRFLYTLNILLIFNLVNAQSNIKFSLEPYVSGLNEPVDIANAGDARLFIVEKRGIIRIIGENGQLLPTPFLDIDARVIASRGEQGLLGLVFHPNYSQNGFFYVNYINNQGNTVVSRFNVSNNNINIADPNSELIILTIQQPFSNHNGGKLAFGPDGFLYIGTGDGGSGGDPQNQSQTRNSLLGKMLRIDVNNGSPYSIPTNNPFVNDTLTRDEIWALGLRNPWRYSFDRLTGDLWIADVGQGNWEEINRTTANSPGGHNYGWRCYEGNANFNTNGCNNWDTYVFPIHVYRNDGTVTGCSVTGGYVYRGTRYPNLQGRYIYADYCSGRFWALTPGESGVWTNADLLDTNYNVVSFGEDQNGELYVAAVSPGAIYRVVGDATTSTANPLSSYNIKISPNPSSDLINISMDVLEEDNYQFRLMDALGRTLREWQDQVGKGFVKQLSLREFPQGLYVLQVYKDGQIITRKIQKM
ncbi:MAG: PQQ-dependent sugar dehydrogenase [Saprospiraceae bacterium]